MRVATVLPCLSILNHPLDSILICQLAGITVDNDTTPDFDEPEDDRKRDCEALDELEPVVAQLLGILGGGRGIRDGAVIEEDAAVLEDAPDGVDTDHQTEEQVHQENREVNFDEGELASDGTDQAERKGGRTCGQNTAPTGATEMMPTRAVKRRRGVRRQLWKSRLILCFHLGKQVSYEFAE